MSELSRTRAVHIDVTPGATYFGLIRLIDRIGLARRVLRILEHAPELAGPSKK